MREETAKRIIDSVHSGYNTIAAEFTASRGKLWWRELESFSEYVRAGDRVLDLGCGSGRAHRLFSGLAVDYEGIDVSDKLIAQARREVRDPLANFRVGSMLSLPYDDRSFDAVMAVASLHHVPSGRFRLQALREAFRVLKPGGQFMMTNWHLWQLPRLKWFLRNVALKIVGLSDLDWTDVRMPWKRTGKSAVWRYYHGFTVRELGRLCRQVGFEVEINELSGERRRRGDVNLLTVCRRPTAD